MGIGGAIDWPIKPRRRPRWPERRITRVQNTQFKIVDMATEVKFGRTFLDGLIVDHVQGMNVTFKFRWPSTGPTEMAVQVTDGCLQLHGGYVYCEEYPIERDWRYVRVMSILADTNEIMKEIVAK